MNCSFLHQNESLPELYLVPFISYHVNYCLGVTENIAKSLGMVATGPALATDSDSDSDSTLSTYYPKKCLIFVLLNWKLGAKWFTAIIGFIVTKVWCECGELYWFLKIFRTHLFFKFSTSGSNDTKFEEFFSSCTVIIIMHFVIISTLTQQKHRWWFLTCSFS